MKEFTLAPKLDEHDEVTPTALESLTFNFAGMSVFKAREHLYIKTQGWLKAMEQSVVESQIAKLKAKVAEDTFVAAIRKIGDPKI